MKELTTKQLCSSPLQLHRLIRVSNWMRRYTMGEKLARTCPHLFNARPSFDINHSLPITPTNLDYGLDRLLNGTFDPASQRLSSSTALILSI